MKVIKFAPGLIPVLKHGEHDQSSHGNWADGSEKWLTTRWEKETEYIYNHDKGLLRVKIPNEFVDNPDYQEGIKTSLETIGDLQLEYPITSVVKFFPGDDLYGEEGVLGETLSASVDGVPTASQINLTEGLLKSSFDLGKEGVIYVITHEWGHALDTRSSERAKSDFDKVVNPSYHGIETKSGSLPMTSYGMEGWREMYAEAFAVKHLNSHKGGTSRTDVEQTDDWKYVFDIFELDSLKKSIGNKVSFSVKDTFSTSNPPVLIEDNVLVLKHGEHDQSSHGNWADGVEGGNGLTHRDVYQLQSGMSDTLVRKIYDAEEKYQPNVQRELPKPFAPSRTEYQESAAYDKAYKAYSKAFDEWSRESTKNIKSTTGEKHLDGSKAGVQKYVDDVTSSDWFIERFGRGGVIGTPKVSLGALNVAGKYEIGTKNGVGYSRLSMDKGYSQAEPIILHELAHYATAISANKPYAGHGVEFARNYVYMAGKVMGPEYAAGLESSYREAGVPIG